MIERIGVSMKGPRKWAAAVIAIIVAVSAFGCASGGDEGSTQAEPVTKPNSNPESAQLESVESEPAKPKPDEPAESDATPSQENALRAATNYLDYESFSESGLIEQLEYEGYSAADAKYGATHVGADWNEQAVKGAKAYLEYESFSESGLVEQLEYEGFTPSQAEYGVSKAYR
jgi:hypothetical protein